jgi:hypothetical protein
MMSKNLKYIHSASAVRERGIGDDRNTIPVEVRLASPAEIVEERLLPLYIRVAQWAMECGCLITREDIARAFRTTPRRAGDIMLYIHGPGAGLIESQRYLSREGGGREVAFLRVTEVRADQYVPPRGGRPKRMAPIKEPSENAANLRELRDLFLKRRLVPEAS